MILQDAICVDGFRRTGDGYLTISARVARAGNVQNYSGREVDRPDLGTVRVYRPEDSVFNKDTLASFAHRPVTFGHPSSAVTASNWRDVAKGWSGDEVARDGEFVRVSMLIADATTISAIESGTRELSMGYDCQLDWTPGKSPSGVAYDAVQRSIRSNHIAVVDAARGGKELRLGDSSEIIRKELHMMTDAEKRTMRDSVRGMPVSEAVKLPIYDDFRGNPQFLTRCAFLDGAVPDSQPTADQDRVRAYRDHMEHKLSNAWNGDSVAKPDAAPVPEYTKDGRHISTLSDSERAHHEMVSRQANAWRR